MLRLMILIILATVLSAGVFAQNDAPPPVPRDDLSLLIDEIDRLREEVHALREALAKARLEADEAQRELEELRQFIDDHHQLGQDFQQYRAIKQIAEEEARRRLIEQRRQELEREKAERAQRRRQALAEREARRAEQAKVASYRERGFSPLGLDVYLSAMAYSYGSVDDPGYRVDWSPSLGRYLRVASPRRRIDFSRMTISGSVVNASDELRHIGVAIAFFDGAGNQVGHEIVQINNARPGVPYPFTSEVLMALDEPFASSTQYVLYADAAEAEME